MGSVGKPAKYFTFFTLFQPQELCNSSVSAFALWGLLLLFVGGIVLFIASIRVFVKKTYLYRYFLKFHKKSV